MRLQRRLRFVHSKPGQTKLWVKTADIELPLADVGRWLEGITSPFRGDPGAEFVITIERGEAKR